MSNKRWLLLLAVLAAVLLSLPATAVAADEAPRISADELKSRLGEPRLLIVDVRDSGSWKAAARKILGAERVDPPALKSWAAIHDKGDTIVLYCS